LAWFLLAVDALVVDHGDSISTSAFDLGDFPKCLYHLISCRVGSKLPTLPLVESS
jgi:hypothetical protein